MPWKASNRSIARMMLRRNPDEFVDQRSDQEVIEGVSSLQPPAKKSKIKERAVSTVSANKNGAGKTNMLKHS